MAGTSARRWYGERAHVKFAEQPGGEPDAVHTTRALSAPRGLIIRQSERRWGSMSPAARLLLNLRLIEAPTECIDYFVTHELCHLTEAHHGPAFFHLLSRVMPDWPKRERIDWNGS